VVVIGASGAGKTTFARELARRIAAPHVELDAIHWLPNWTERGPDEFRSLVDQATSADRWVLDGGYACATSLGSGRPIWCGSITLFQQFSRASCDGPSVAS
jgi:adenylate kinase family enzyme